MTISSGASMAPERLPMKLIVLDIVERVFIAGMFVYFANNMLSLSQNGLNPIFLLLIVSESLPIVLSFLRGPTTAISRRPSDWFLGFGASTMPLLAVPAVGATALAPAAFCIVLMVAGILLQTAAKIFLGRSFGVIAANRGVKIAGPYQFIRHPMYAGYVMTHIAFLLTQPSLHNFAVYTLALAFQIVRIGREEGLLTKDESYRAYAGEVRYRLVPGVY